MSVTLVERPADVRLKGGGSPARRAVLRWGFRLFPREWRQQVLVLGLLTTAVAVMIASTTFVYHLPTPGSAEFGSANTSTRYGQSSPARATRIAAVRAAFPDTETIAHRFIDIPGSVDQLDIRAQDARAPLGRSMLSLISGRYPSGATEAAITRHLASTLAVSVGQTLRVGTNHWRVVGIVENPGNLDEQFLLTSPAATNGADEVTLIFDATAQQRSAFEAGHRDVPPLDVRQNDQPLAAAIALVLATAILLLVCLVALAGFTVVGQRRLRQVGMLGALGATERQRRLVMLANGFIVGIVAVVIGTPFGFALWVVVAPLLERAAAHRVDRFALPWPLVLAGLTLTVASATAAAWWPGRSLARTPIVSALSERPSAPKPTHRSALVGVVVTAAGVVCFAFAEQHRAVLIIGGTLLLAAGIPLLAPLGIRLVAACSGRMPFTVRLALRDLARYRARSAAALASISLALGIAMSIVIFASATPHPQNDGNLSPSQLLIRTTPANDALRAEPTPEENATIAATTKRITGGLGHPMTVQLSVALSDLAVEHAGNQRVVASRPSGSGGHKEVINGDQNAPRIAVWLAKVVRVGHGIEVGGNGDVAKLYIATPSLLRFLHIDAATIRPDADVVTTRHDISSWEFVGLRDVGGRPKLQVVLGDARYSSMPTTLLTEQAVKRHGWKEAPGGSVVETAHPLSDAQVSDARKIAAAAGIAIETRDYGSTRATLRTGATVAGALLALAILAMTVGLIRAEGAADLRVLTAVGASARVHRGLTAATAASLAFVGALIGTSGAYIAVAAWHSREVNLANVPVLDLCLAIFALPAIAAVGGWLGAGRRSSKPQLRRAFD